MKARITLFLVICLAILALSGYTETQCDWENWPGIGGGPDAEFKVPLAPGYNWEITQSWAEHCDICEAMYPGGTHYCDSSHAGPCCYHSWDFNLPGSTDQGKPVLASESGVVKVASSGWNGGWGNTVVIDHGKNICTRYAHLLDDSIRVSAGEEVCQGLILASIGGTGNAAGPHLHFQFEECDSGETIDRGFDDGNGIPMCRRGSDIYDSSGNYDFLKLTNEPTYRCGSSGDDDDDDGDGDDDDDDDDDVEVPWGEYPIGDNNKWSEALDFDCFVDDAMMGCYEDGRAVIEVNCNITNNGDETLKVNNMHLTATDSSDLEVCTLVDADLRGRTTKTTHNFDPGESDTLQGIFEFHCTDLPDDGDIDMKFDLLERVDNQSTWYMGLFEDEVTIELWYILLCQVMFL